MQRALDAAILDVALREQGVLVCADVVGDMQYIGAFEQRELAAVVLEGESLIVADIVEFCDGFPGHGNFMGVRYLLSVLTKICGFTGVFPSTISGASRGFHAFAYIDGMYGSRCLP
ncbi:hypothetical protein D9M72_587420 [compost metagenome]